MEESEYLDDIPYDQYSGGSWLQRTRTNVVSPACINGTMYRWQAVRGLTYFYFSCSAGKELEGSRVLFI